MITYQKYIYAEQPENSPVYYAEGTCLSSDQKPEGLANGSKLLEMDTGTLYMYDSENKTWRAWTVGHWTACNAMGEIISVKDDVADVKGYKNCPRCD